MDPPDEFGMQFSNLNDLFADFDREDPFSYQDLFSLGSPMQSDTHLAVGLAGSSLRPGSPFLLPSSGYIIKETWSEGATEECLGRSTSNDSSEVVNVGGDIELQTGAKFLAVIGQTTLREPGTRQRRPRTHWGIEETNRLADLKEAGYTIKKIAQTLNKEFQGFDITREQCGYKWGSLRKDFLSIRKHDARAQTDKKGKSYWSMNDNERANSSVKLQTSPYYKCWYDAVEAVENDNCRMSPTARSQSLAATRDSSIHIRLPCSSGAALSDDITDRPDETRSFSSNHSAIITGGIEGRPASSKVNIAVDALHASISAASTAGEMLFSVNEESVDTFRQQITENNKRRRLAEWEERTNLEAKRQRKHTAGAP